MKSKGSQNRYSKLITVIVGLGLLQILVFMPAEKNLVDMASLGSRQVSLASAPETYEKFYFKSARMGTSLSNDIDFDIDTTDLTLLYLHVGKTGGMSLDRILRTNCVWRSGKDPKKRCFEELLKGDDELLLSKKTKRTLHMDLPTPDAMKSLYQTSEILWTLRNPITRMVSALDMRANHVYIKDDDYFAKVFYEKCGFGTAQAIADELEHRTNHTVIKIPRTPNSQQLFELDCHDYAKGTLEGAAYGFMGVGQAKFNYAHYAQVAQVLGNKKNFAFRTEHLWEDVIQTNQLLIANDEAADTSSSMEMDWVSNVKNISSHKFTHGSEKYQTKSKLTQRGKEIFCCYLSDENAIYENVLLSAINLSDKQKAESLESLYRDCGILSSDRSVSMIGGFDWQKWKADECPTHTSISDIGTMDTLVAKHAEKKRKIHNSVQETKKLQPQQVSFQ